MPCRFRWRHICGDLKSKQCCDEPPRPGTIINNVGRSGLLWSEQSFNDTAHLIIDRGGTEGDRSLVATVGEFIGRGDIPRTAVAVAERDHGCFGAKSLRLELIFQKGLTRQMKLGDVVEV